MDHHRGTHIFMIIWTGQALSTLGTAMTRFALLIWAYDQTGRATTLALLGFFSFIVYVVVGPAAGVLVDRWDRRRVMLAADLSAGLITLSFLALYSTGELRIWHLYAGEALTGFFEAFQHPAYNASMSVLVPRAQLSRFNGLRSLSWDATNILAPVLAGLMLHGIGLGSVMLVDLGTLGAAVISLLSVQIPRPCASREGSQARELGLRRELAFGTQYILQRPGLLGLTVIYMLIFLYAGITYFGVLPAMILARSGGRELVLSSVQSALGVGGIVGGVVVTIWDGPKRKIHGVLAFCAASFLLGDTLFAAGRTPPAWIAAAFASAFFIPFMTSAQRAIWQSKVPPDIQGRVLAAAFAWGQVTRPLGYLLAGPLADRVFEPAMMPGGTLDSIFGGLVGVGPGAGMGLMFLLTAALGCASCLGAYLFAPLRRIDTDLPDYDAVPASGLAFDAGAAD